MKLRAPLLVTGSEAHLGGVSAAVFPVVSVGIIESTLLENPGDTGDTCGSSQVGYDTLLDTQVKVRTNKQMLSSSLLVIFKTATSHIYIYMNYFLFYLFAWYKFVIHNIHTHLI